MPLRCPTCAEVLAPFDSGPATFDLCRSCGGLWIDPAELSRVRGAPSVLARLRFTRASPRYCPRCRTTAPGGRDTCEACRSPTARCLACRTSALRVLAAGPCTLAVCALCRGFWLAGGDLTAITRATDLSVKMQLALDGEHGSATDGKGECGRCGDALRGRTAWRSRGGVLCPACVRGAAVRKPSRGRRRQRDPGLEVLEVLGCALEFVEVELPPSLDATR